MRARMLAGTSLEPGDTVLVGTTASGKPVYGMVMIVDELGRVEIDYEWPEHVTAGGMWVLG